MTDSTSRPRWWQGSWYFVITVLSLGLLAWVPFVHGAVRLRSRGQGIRAIVYLALAALAVALLVTARFDPQGNPTGIGLIEIFIGVDMLFWLAVVGCLAQRYLRREVYDPTRGAERQPTVLRSAEDRRRLARKLVADDPKLSRWLHIGRPDRRRHLDDGGLVDLNTASARAIAGPAAWISRWREPSSTRGRPRVSSTRSTMCSNGSISRWPPDR